MQWHRLPHQAGDVGELRARALQPCATSWIHLLHNIGSLSAATTVKVQLVLCRLVGAQHKMQGGHEGWQLADQRWASSTESTLQPADSLQRGRLLAYLWAASRGQLALVQGPMFASSHKTGSIRGHGLHRGNAVCTVPRWPRAIVGHRICRLPPANQMRAPAAPNGVRQLQRVAAMPLDLQHSAPCS